MGLKSKLILLLSAYFLIGCGSPKKEFWNFIQDKNYIPYATPLGEAGVGTIVKGNAKNLRLAVKPQRCLPDMVNGIPTNLRWAQETVLPSEYSNFEVGFKVDLSPLTYAANPLLQFNMSYGQAKFVNIQFEGATIESLEEVPFGAYYKNYMSDECIQFIESYPFIVQALKIEKMKFEFKTKNQGSIYINPGNISDIVNIGAGVSWKIEKGTSLVVDTPKYIGYQVAKLSRSDNGMINRYATKIDKKGEFQFENAMKFAKRQRVKGKTRALPLQYYNQSMDVKLRRRR